MLWEKFRGRNEKRYVVSVLVEEEGGGGGDETSIL
jgi:hypothetical protein